MAASMQGWRKKWFYIKDQKNSSSDQHDIAPFDANKELKKLASWDSPPTEAEMEDIKPLLARIQTLKSGSGGALSGTQLMLFFLQRRV
jgi:sugar (pentulose or hexulose) kinase